jgi:hypothetical protein
VAFEEALELGAAARDDGPRGGTVSSDLHGYLIQRLNDVDEARRQATRAAFVRASRRETMAGLMLGTLAVALGIFLTCVSVAGIAGHPRDGWHSAEDLLKEVRPRVREPVLDPESGKTVLVAKKVIANTVYLPSGTSLAAALLGLCMAATGFSRRRVSPLAAAAGTLLSLSLLMPVANLLLQMAFYWFHDTFH